MEDGKRKETTAARKTSVLAQLYNVEVGYEIDYIKEEEDNRCDYVDIDEKKG